MSVSGGKVSFKVGFSNQDDEELIENVSGYDILWKLSHPDYKSNIKKDVIWNKIGLQLNKTGGQCKVRWRSIRDNFKRHKKTEAAGTGQPAKKKRATYWDQLRFLDDVEDERQGFTSTQEPRSPQLEFIESNDPSLDEDSNGNVEPLSPCNDVNPQTAATSLQSSSSSSVHQTAPNIKKKPKGQSGVVIDLLTRRAEDQCNLVRVIEKIATQQGSTKEEDEMDVFMRSMSMTIKKFTPAEQSEAKRKIFQVVNQLEERHHAVANR